MRSKRSFYLLLGITALMVAAAVLFQRPDKEYSGSHGLHAPELGERAERVRSVVIRTADGELRLARGETGWVARNKGDYAADAERVRELVLGLSRLERLEKKTSDPQRLARLELTDVEETGSKAVEVTLLDGDGDELGRILVGKTADFQSSGYSRYFVRDAGDPQAWLVRGTLPPVLEDAASWLQQDLLPGIEAGDFRSIELIRPDGETVEVGRESRQQADLTLADLSDGEEVDDQYAIDQIGDTLVRLSLKDVEQRGEEAGPPPVLTVEALTFDGVRITASFQRREPDYAVILSAAYDPALDAGDVENADQDGDKDNQTATGNGAEPGDEEAAESLGGEALAGRLNERWQGRLFIVSEYAVDALMVERSDLVNTAAENQ